LNRVAKDDLASDYFDSKTVIIIGGGNVATDAARTAIRLKAEKVTMVCLEQKNEMPAYETEISEAEEEGIEILNGWGISSIINSEDKNLVEVKLNKCKSVLNESRNFAPTYDECVVDNISGDEVIICIGQKADTAFMNDEIRQSIFSNGKIEVNRDTLQTDLSGIFAGGDIVSGPASVIDAIGHGRRAARSIDKFLGGDGIINFDEDLHKDNEMFIGREEGFSIIEREKINYINADKRKLNFNPFELTYQEDSAIKEGSRCLRCDLRLNFRHNPHPPEKYLKFNSNNIETVPSKEGVIQLLDEKKEVYNIKGTDNMNETLLEILDDNEKASYFIYETDPMFTKRESELLQQYLQKHGKMPDSCDDLDDLF
jgi:hypothetical protein